MLITREDQGRPITFHDAPTVTSHTGRRHLTDDAARELGDRLAQRHAGLLERLAGE